jgi:hypothetical protein
MARLTSAGILFDLADTNNSINSFYWMYPPGTTKIFFQASAPVGWTKSITHNNKGLRVISGTGGGSGGTTNFTSCLSSTNNLTTPFNVSSGISVVPGTASNIGNHTLTLNQIPDHTHPTPIGQIEGRGSTPFSNAGARLRQGSTATGGMIESSGGGSHNHPFSGTVTLNQSFISNPNLAVTYVDVIICSLD